MPVSGAGCLACVLGSCRQQQPHIWAIQSKERGKKGKKRKEKPYQYRTVPCHSMPYRRYTIIHECADAYARTHARILIPRSGLVCKGWMGKAFLACCCRRCCTILRTSYVLHATLGHYFGSFCLFLCFSAFPPPRLFLPFLLLSLDRPGTIARVQGRVESDSSCRKHLTRHA